MKEKEKKRNNKWIYRKKAKEREHYTTNLTKKARRTHKECAWLGAVALQNMLSLALAENFIAYQKFLHAWPTKYSAYQSLDVCCFSDVFLRVLLSFPVRQ